MNRLSRIFAKTGLCRPARKGWTQKAKVEAQLRRGLRGA